ncbi:MAG: sensor histidine kinase [Fimbriimonas sp.]
MSLPVLRWINERLVRLSRSTILGLALLASIGVGVADHFIGFDLLIIYLIPLFVAAWYGGARAGYMVAIYSSGASFITQVVVTGSTEFNRGAIGDLVVRLLAFTALASVFDRLHEARRQQEELVGFIVHDLRSPLASAITGLMTLEQTADAMNESEREMVQLALISNQRALGLVNSMLDVAKLESGTLSVHKEPVETEVFLAESLQSVALWARDASVTIRTEVERKTTNLDRQLTERVMTNLVSNALKFSPPKGTILIRVVEDGHNAVFEIIDEGPGIPPEYVEKIFDPFTQVKGTKGGTGLGLTFCRLAILAQGGRIGVRSTLGQGSTFWFSLPKDA